MLATVILLAAVVPSCSAASKFPSGKQTVAAKGQLLCGDQPHSEAIIKLWDDDVVGKLPVRTTRALFGLRQRL